MSILVHLSLKGNYTIVRRCIIVSQDALTSTAWVSTTKALLMVGQTNEDVPGLDAFKKRNGLFVEINNPADIQLVIDQLGSTDHIINMYQEPSIGMSTIGGMKIPLIKRVEFKELTCKVENSTANYKRTFDYDLFWSFTDQVRSHSFYIVTITL